MYQINFQNGYQIQVIGRGEKGICRVVDRHQNIMFSGVYAACETWLNNRAVFSA